MIYTNSASFCPFDKLRDCLEDTISTISRIVRIV